MRLALDAYARSKIKRLEKLADRMAEIAQDLRTAEAGPTREAPQPEPTTTRTPEANPPLLDLEAPDEAPADAPTRRRRSIYGSLD